MNTPATSNGLTFLRPYLFKSTPLKHNQIYLRLFNTACARRQAQKHSFGKNVKSGPKVAKESNDVEERVKALSEAKALKWPRIRNSSYDLTVIEFLDKFKYLKKGEEAPEETVVLRGRMQSCRLAGNKLAFFDVVQDYVQMQAVCNFAKLSFSGVTQAQFRKCLKLIQRGDIVCE